MKKPNNFGLVYAVNSLRELVDYLIEIEEDACYDLHLVRGAADTVEQYLDDNNVTLLETENEKTTEPKETDPTAPDLDIGPDYPYPIR